MHLVNLFEKRCQNTKKNLELNKAVIQYAVYRNTGISLFKIMYHICDCPDLKSNPKMGNPSQISKTTEYT